jgi:hypothetical protein
MTDPSGQPGGRAPTSDRQSGGPGQDGRRRREEYLANLLRPSAVSLGDLSPATRTALHEYARFMLVVAAAQSASWNSPVIELCRAVESEIAVALGDCPGLGGLRKATTLGEKAHLLRNLTPTAKGWLSSRQYLQYVSTALPRQLHELAQVRSSSGAAHGGPDERHATRADHNRVLLISLTGANAVIPSLVRLRRRAPPAR